MNDAIIQAEDYIEETLGISVQLNEWPEKRKLPLFLRQEFDFAETQILGRPVLIAAAIAPEHSAAAVRKQFEVLQPKFDGELVYLRQQIDAYQRKRLIEQRVSFIVPGNQLYLPTFAIDLRDYFRKAKTATDKLSPLAQATYLYAIYHGDLLPLPLHRAAELLECSKMSMSRTFSELEALELVDVEKEGRSRDLRFKGAPFESWELARRYLRTPVRKRLRVFHDFPIPQRSRIAGQPALAMETEITKGQDRIIAIGPTVEKAVREELARFTIPSDESERSMTIELWRYDPCLLSKGTSVDRLSLYLSLEATGDERVEAALDDLLKGMPW
jgi:hypothetical protein